MESKRLDSAFILPIRSSIIAALALGLLALAPLTWAQEIVLYDNTMFEAKPPPGAPPNVQPPWGTRGDTHFAQQFYTGEADNVSSVKLTIKRTGSPGGKISFEIWDTGDDGFPGEMVGSLSEIEVDSLPTELETIEIPGIVVGLQQMTHYYLVYRNIDIDFNASWNLDDSTVGARTYHVPTLFEGLNGGPGPASHPSEGAPLQSVLWRSNLEDGWQTLTYAVPLPADYIHMRIAGSPSHTLTITQPELGAISVSPQLDSYPSGTEITLTATPDEGYRVIDLIVLRSGAGHESSRGRAYEENPRTFTINQNTEVRATIVPEITPNVLFDNLAVRGDDPNGSGADLKTTFDRNPVHAEYPISVAQRFRAGSTGKVTAVEVGINRVGTPGGSLLVSVREVDVATGEPGNMVSQFAEFEANSLPEVDSWCLLPLKLEPFRVEGYVGGLESGKDYFLYVTEDPDDLPQASPPGAGCGYQGMVIDTVPAGGEDQVAESSLTFFDWPWDQFEPGEWGPFDPNNDHTMRFRIEGAPTHTLTIPPSEPGIVTVSPNLPSYPAGAEVTLTATPNEGYQFAGWTAETTGAPETATAFDNLDHTVGDFNSPLGRDRRFAQQFVMGGTTTLKQVELVFHRIGSVQGGMAVELWNDDGKSDPGEKIADLGIIDDVSAMPTSDTIYAFDTVVNDLDPDGKYWVVIQFEAITSSLNQNNTIAWRWSFSDQGTAGADDAHVLRAQDNGVWARMTDVFGDPILMHRMRVQTISAGATEQLELPRENPLTFTIEADTTITPKFAEIPSSPTLTINQSEHGTVTADPDLSSYPAGAEVTLTATPNESYLFTGWDGDTNEEGNPSSITLTMDADKTIGGLFSPIVEPKVQAVEFDAAGRTVRLTWDSQAAAVYEIEMSTDLLGWESLGTRAGTGDQTSAVVDTSIGNNPQRFYRLRLRRP
ncbi:MAG: choice-of-anchor R domain-containing protein [Verrucomicrobiales bacterium]